MGTWLALVPFLGSAWLARCEPESTPFDTSLRPPSILWLLGALRSCRRGADGAEGADGAGGAASAALRAGLSGLELTEVTESREE